VPTVRGVKRRVRHRVDHLRGDRFAFNGVKLDLSGPWASYAVHSAIYDGVFEAHEREVLLRTLRPDDVVLELGCGMGYITTLAAGVAREVHSFDANPQMVEVARATVARNNRRATIENAVLARSPEAETVPFYVDPNFTVSSLSPSDGAKRVDIPLLDLAKACEGCTYMIVDIEGAEVDLLSGEIPGIRAICVECHPWITDAEQITAMLSALFEQGFALDIAKSSEIVLYLERA
jgi:FkbM family methyltransferase